MNNQNSHDMKKCIYSVNIYLFKVTIEIQKKKCDICSKFTIKTPEWHYWRRSGVFIVNFEYILIFF